MLPPGKYLQVNPEGTAYIFASAGTGTSGSSGSSGTSGADGQTYGTSGTSGVNGATGSFSGATLQFNSGTFSGLDMTGTPLYYDVVETLPNSYGVNLDSNAIRSWSITNKTNSGFRVESNSTDTFSDIVYWQVIEMSSGILGAFGSSGTSGTSGTSGSSGINGIAGSSGSSGSSGINGIAGSSGTSGANGANGSSGTSGINGSSGTSGANGSSGTSGSSGSSGINGSSGATGSTPVDNKTPIILTDATTIGWTYSLGYNAQVTLGGSRSLSIVGATAGDYGTLLVVQGPTGGYRINFSSENKFPYGTYSFSITGTQSDVYNFYYNGINYYWNYQKRYS
jgi:hypothetical protein